VRRLITLLAVLMAGGAVVAPVAGAAADVLRIAPKQINFGSRAVGTENYAGVTVTNRSGGTVNLLVTGTRLPDDFGFGLMPGSTCPALGPEPLAPGASCDAVIRFSPSEFFAGTQQTAELTVTATDPVTGEVIATETVAVRGRGSL
jgi:hypothetical protein